MCCCAVKTTTYLPTYLPTRLAFSFFKRIVNVFGFLRFTYILYDRAVSERNRDEITLRTITDRWSNRMFFFLKIHIRLTMHTRGVEGKKIFYIDFSRMHTSLNIPSITDNEKKINKWKKVPIRRTVCVVYYIFKLLNSTVWNGYDSGLLWVFALRLYITPSYTWNINTENDTNEFRTYAYTWF